MNEVPTASAKLKRVSSAADNMSALIDEIVRKARREFKTGGDTELDAKFLKESVSALKELYELLSEYGDVQSGGVVVRLEKEIEEWAK